MPFSAILLGGRPATAKVSGYAIRSRADVDAGLFHWPADLSLNNDLPLSLACVEVFGQSVLERMIVTCKKAGLRSLSVIASSAGIGFHETKDVRIAIPKRAEDRWSIVRRTLLRDLQQGIDTVLIADLGAYVEIDLPSALRFHRAKNQRITPIHDSQGPLSYWIVDAARFLSDGHGSLPPDEDKIINPPVPLVLNTYVNRLAHPRDLRRLVVDAFLGRCSIRPSGHEIKPGVWVEQQARVHKTARLVAPCYVGSNTRVRPAAVVTRCSNLERNCNVGEGSLISDASLLPHTFVGRGLDVATAVVDRVDFVDLDRNVTVRIQDLSLISDIPPQKHYVPSYVPEYGDPEHQTAELDAAGLDYLARAKGRLLEVFKGEV